MRAIERDLEPLLQRGSCDKSLDEAVREVIALVLDLRDDPAGLDVAYAFTVPA